MSDQPFLPRFSSTQDVDEFVAVLEQYERGELSPDKFRAFRLTRGVYGQRQEGVQMIRVKIPQGVLAPKQLEVLADVAERFAPRGVGHVTTRQNVQLHFVKMADVETALRALDEVGLTTREACGNTVRTVTCDPLSGLTDDTLFDVRPYGEALTRHFLRQGYAGALPRKFKIAFSASDADRGMTAINDLGFVARERDGKRGFKVFAAGGLSTNPMNAIVLHEFLPAEELLDCGEAAVRLFDRTGNRENKHRARLKYVAKKFGAEKFIEMYREERAAIAQRGATLLTDLPDADEPPPPARDDVVPAEYESVTRGPGYLQWRATSVVAQSQQGYSVVHIRLPLGDATVAQMRAIAQIARKFGDGTIRATLEQNFMLRFVPNGQLPALHKALGDHGLDRAGAGTVVDVTSCPGAESCALAVTASRQLGTSISTRLEALTGEGAAALEAAKTAAIKISGCPNSCGQHHVADLGWHGAVKRVGDKSAPVYQLHLGGGVDGAEGAFFGRQVIKVPARRVAEAVERMLLLFARERTAGETPRSFYRRVDAEKVQALLGDLAALEATGPAEDFVDLGQEAGFVVQIGQGECAA